VPASSSSATEAKNQSTLKKEVPASSPSATEAKSQSTLKKVPAPSANATKAKKQLAPSATAAEAKKQLAPSANAAEAKNQTAPTAKGTKQAPVKANAGSAPLTRREAAPKHPGTKSEPTAVKANPEAAPAAGAAQKGHITTPAPMGEHPPHPLSVTIAVAALCLVLVLANSLYGSRPAAPGQEAGEAAEGGAAQQAAVSDDETLTSEPLTEDTYGMAIASIVRDTKYLTREGGSRHACIRYLRIVAAFKLLAINMGLQLFLISCIAKFSAARAVFGIRNAYSDFETHMYAGHVYLTLHNYSRGMGDKYFNTTLFDTLSETTKGKACRIPFAQPYFLFAMLTIWSLLVVGELKQTLQLFSRLVLRTSTSASMAHATQPNSEDGETIVKLTVGLKVFFTLFMVLPRAAIACVLLWLGCRWLAATTDFQDLVLNSVGLEFVLLLKELLYHTLVPGRVKRDTVRMHVSIAHEATQPSPLAFLGTFLWGWVAVGWVYLYIYKFQAVLPGYRWDVHDVCWRWMKQNYAAWY